MKKKSVCSMCVCEWAKLTAQFILVHHWIKTFCIQIQANICSIETLKCWTKQTRISTEEEEEQITETVNHNAWANEKRIMCTTYSTVKCEGTTTTSTTTKYGNITQSNGYTSRLCDDFVFSLRIEWNAVLGTRVGFGVQWKE